MSTSAEPRGRVEDLAPAQRDVQHAVLYLTKSLHLSPEEIHHLIVQLVAKLCTVQLQQDELSEVDACLTLAFKKLSSAKMWILISLLSIRLSCLPISLNGEGVDEMQHVVHYWIETVSVNEQQQAHLAQRLVRHLVTASLSPELEQELSSCIMLLAKKSSTKQLWAVVAHLTAHQVQLQPVFYIDNSVTTTNTTKAHSSSSRSRSSKEALKEASSTSSTSHVENQPSKVPEVTHVSLSSMKLSQILNHDDDNPNQKSDEPVIIANSQPFQKAKSKSQRIPDAISPMLIPKAMEQYKDKYKAFCSNVRQLFLIQLNRSIGYHACTLSQKQAIDLQVEQARERMLDSMRSLEQSQIEQCLETPLESFIKNERPFWTMHELQVDVDVESLKKKFELDNIKGYLAFLASSTFYYPVLDLLKYMNFVEDSFYGHSSKGLHFFKPKWLTDFWAQRPRTGSHLRHDGLLVVRTIRQPFGLNRHRLHVVIHPIADGGSMPLFMMRDNCDRPFELTLLAHFLGSGTEQLFLTGQTEIKSAFFETKNLSVQKTNSPNNKRTSPDSKYPDPKRKRVISVNDLTNSSLRETIDWDLSNTLVLAS